MDQQPSVLSDQNEECACVFVESQDKVTFHIFEDPFTNLLLLVGNIYFLFFMDQKHMFSRHLEWPSFCFFCLLEENESKILVSTHMLYWLHWKDHFTSLYICLQQDIWFSSGFESIKSQWYVTINMFSKHLEWPSFCFFSLLEESERRIQESNHLLDWLHWKDHFTWLYIYVFSKLVVVIGIWSPQILVICYHQ